MESICLKRKFEQEQLLFYIGFALEQGGRCTHQNDVAVIVWPGESESQGNSEPVSNSKSVPLEWKSTQHNPGEIE